MPRLKKLLYTPTTEEVLAWRRACNEAKAAGLPKPDRPWRPLNRQERVEAGLPTEREERELKRKALAAKVAPPEPEESTELQLSDEDKALIKELLSPSAKAKPLPEATPVKDEALQAALAYRPEPTRRIALTDDERREYAALMQELNRRKRPIFWPIGPGRNRWQERFIRDNAQLKAAICTRRAGKSYAAGLHLLKDMYYNPGVSCLYVGLTRESAARIIWKDVLKVIDDEMGLGAKFNINALTMTLPNGSVLYILGADSSDKERDKMLGQKFRTVVIDEASKYTINLDELVFGVLKPSVADYRGQIILIGTPSNMRKGLYYDLTSGQDPGSPGKWETKGFSCYRWSFRENPYMRDKLREEMEALKQAQPGIEETPFFIQNYYGQWVAEDDSRVYRYLSGRNDFSTLPDMQGVKGSWHYVLGVDLGYNDATAFTLGAYHDFDKTLYFVDAWKREKMDLTDVANRIRMYQSKNELDAIVVDGANKQGVEEMRRRHGLPLQTADKRDKAAFIELMNSDFITGRVKLHITNCSALAEEYDGLIWDPRHIQPGTEDKQNKIYSKKVEHPHLPNHLCDASLYCWRKCYQYLSATPPGERPKPGSKEWNDEEEKQAVEYLEQSVREQIEAERLENEWF